MNRWMLIGSLVAGLALGTGSGAWVHGADHSSSGPIRVGAHWPAGLTDLVQSLPRVHGFYVDARDWFYYSGDAKAFNAFLQAYAKLPGVEHRLVIEPGVGAARSPWSKSPGLPCDWELSIQDKKPCEVVVKLWVGGRVMLDRVELPETVTVVVSASARTDSPGAP